MAASRNQHPGWESLCTKYQIKYSCLGPDKSLRLHKHWPCLLIGLHYSLCIHPGFACPPPHTYIIKIHIRFFHPFPQPSKRAGIWFERNFWRFPLIVIAALSVMMWCEILDNLQFNKFLWNEWSLIVWCEAARGAACCVILDPVNNCNNFLPLPARPHIIRHLVFPWECVLIPGRHYIERAAWPDVSKGYITPTILHSRLLHYICITFTISKVKSSKNEKCTI